MEGGRLAWRETAAQQHVTNWMHLTILNDCMEHALNGTRNDCEFDQLGAKGYLQRPALDANNTPSLKPCQKWFSKIPGEDVGCNRIRLDTRRRIPFTLLGAENHRSIYNYERKSTMCCKLWYTEWPLSS